MWKCDKSKIEKAIEGMNVKISTDKKHNEGLKELVPIFLLQTPFDFISTKESGTDIWTYYP